MSDGQGNAAGPILDAVVTLRNEVYPWLRILQVAPDGWDLPNFAPGQYTFLSMLTTHLELATKRRVVLIHGVRHTWDLGYRSTLMAMQHLRPRFTYLPVIGRPAFEPVPWRGATGNVQDVWKNGALEHACGFRPRPDTHDFLCGSPDMIESITELLARERFEEHTKDKPGQIHVERYWPRIRDGKRASGPRRTGHSGSRVS